MSAEENKEQVKVSDESFITKNDSISDLMAHMPSSEEALEKTETGWAIPGQTYSVAGEEVNWSNIWSNVEYMEGSPLKNWKNRDFYEEMRSVMTETSVFG